MRPIDPKKLMKKSQIRIVKARFIDLHNDLMLSLNNPHYIKKYSNEYKQNIEALNNCLGFILSQKQITKQIFILVPIGNEDKIKETLIIVRICLIILEWISKNTNQTEGVDWCNIDLYEQNLSDLKHYSVILKDNIVFLDSFFFEKK